MTDMTDEEIQKHVDAVVAEIGPELELLRKKSRNEFLQESLEDMKKHGVAAEKLLSDGWWEHIPDEEPRHWLTGLYMSPPVNSKVVVCDKDHPFLEAWMRAPGVVGVVLSVQPESIITILGKDGKQVRIPGIPRVEVAFSEDDYEGGFYLPADCVKVLEDEDYQEAKNARR